MRYNQKKHFVNYWSSRKTKREKGAESLFKGIVVPNFQNLEIYLGILVHETYRSPNQINKEILSKVHYNTAVKNKR